MERSYKRHIEEWVFSTGSCAYGGEMQLLFVLHHLPRHQLFRIVATFTDCNKYLNTKRKTARIEGISHYLGTKLCIS